MSERDKLLLMAMLEERMVRESRCNLLRFTSYTMPTFDPADFHKRYYSLLTKFAYGEIKKLMVFMPPQHGKSEGSTRRLPAFILGKEPNTKIAIVSYNAPKARKFNREIQRIIDTEEYSRVFPKTRLNSSNVTTIAGSWLRNADECEIVGSRGGFKTVGVGGALTGDPVDVLIMDDLYKDAKTAWSPTVREAVSDWYDTVAETRLHNNSQQLLVFTRWHEDDLAGTLLVKQGVYSEENPNGWTVCVFPAIKEDAPSDYDPRMPGEALWPERHSIEKLNEVKKRNPQVFGSLYQQNPKPAEGLMYPLEWKTYETLPITKRHKRKNYTDTADTGADFLCSIDYVETEIGNFIIDILYTDKPMEYTEPETAKMITRDAIEVAVIESNNGGRGFGRNVEKNCRLLGNTKTSISFYTQRNNKQVRIFTYSADVQNMTYFPVGWEKKWYKFYQAISRYLKEGSNDHDDAPDCLTGTFEQRGTEGTSASRVAAFMGR